MTEIEWAGGDSCRKDWGILKLNIRSAAFLRSSIEAYFNHNTSWTGKRRVQKKTLI